MKPELETKLVEDFPDIYRRIHLSMYETCMCWGFECDDGWEPIIRAVSAKIDYLCKRLNYRVEMEQVKEKYGTLRMYFNLLESDNVKDRLLFDIINDIIDAAETLSANTCEICGEMGSRYVSPSGWISTLCHEHRKEQEKRYV